MKIKLYFSALLLNIVFSSCAQNASKIIIPTGDPKPVKGEAVAYFAEGCFWHTEIVFQSLYGVRDAVSGYAGGKSENPDYEMVTSGNTGHAETVKVYYDPSKISYQTLVDAFFASHDPTQVNRQGNDVGSQYRSVAFYSNDTEKKILENTIADLSARKKYTKKIATQITKLNMFYPAEDYHQEYILHHPDNGYVKNVNLPEYEHFRKTFKGRFKPSL